MNKKARMKLEQRTTNGAVKQELDAQFQRLKDEAQTLFGMVDERPGVRSREEWELKIFLNRGCRLTVGGSTR